MAIQLPDKAAELDPGEFSERRHKYEPEIDRLSNILKAFNEHFGNITWTDADRVRRMITEEIPAKVAYAVSVFVALLAIVFVVVSGVRAVWRSRR